MYAIECNNLTHYYGKKLVYENLSFRVEEGKILGLLGKNGSGKSTTINIMNGFLHPTSGECLIYGEDSQHLSPATKERIGFLIEGHIQYAFMNVHQIEKFYSGCYRRWNSDPYWELLSKLQVTPTQKISRMSCGQRSQVALGLILAQDPSLLVLDDFSMGLDPGYRRLFIDYLREYAKANNKTVFVTSHIIQDMERLIDDVLIMDYNRILAQQPVEEFMGKFRRYDIVLENPDIQFPKTEIAVNVEQIRDKVSLFGYITPEEVKGFISQQGISCKSVEEVKMNLEDAFIGLTGKY
ncbi:MAG: ABC transporter ATP-binding protein [Bacteroidales bacterium]